MVEADTCLIHAVHLKKIRDGRGSFFFHGAGAEMGKINVVFFISFICFWCFNTSAELLQHRHKTNRGGNILHLRIYILAD